MRAALYARYSSDLQNERSAEDQLAALRDRAAARGWPVVGEYADKGISGSAILTREGVQRLLSDARRGLFDVVLTEALDRLSRSQSDIARLYEMMSFHGVRIETLSSGAVSELHVGLEGTMNRLFLVELGKKTRRGLIAKVKAGLSGGGRCYGYTIPAKGELEIDETEAATIRRVFALYAGGESPRNIAARLNHEALPGPRGGEWTAATINGDRRAQDGMLHNELYVGVRVFNRRRFRKHPETGARSSVLNPPEEWIREPTPHLRILDDDLWFQVQRRKAALSDQPKAKARKPKRLLSGLLTCGVCGGSMTLQGPRYACSAHRERGTCTNARIIAADAVERRVIDGVRKHLLAPDVVERAVRAYHDELATDARTAARERSVIEKELAETSRRLARTWDLYETGALDKDVAAPRLSALQAEKTALGHKLASIDAPKPVRLHPRAAEHYRALVETIEQALAHEDGDEVRTAFRGLIDRVTFTPADGRGQFTLDVAGKLTALLETNRAGACEVLVGAGTGFEPVTFRL